MKEQIRDKALELGFDSCRVTSANRPLNAAFFEEWLQKNNHGEMAYLARNAHKRVEPRRVLDEAQSVITLATNYYRDEILEDKVGKQGRGIIARYAQFEDYHDVIGERLKVLSRFVDETGGDGTRSLSESIVA